MVRAAIPQRTQRGVMEQDMVILPVDRCLEWRNEAEHSATQHQATSRRGAPEESLRNPACLAQVLVSFECLVIPAKAGIQHQCFLVWIPACAE